MFLFLCSGFYLTQPNPPPLLATQTFIAFFFFVQLYAKVCLEVSDDHDFEEDAHTDKIELRKIRYVDLHRQLKPMRMKNMRIQLIKTFNPESLNALNDAEAASGQVWRVETASVDIYRKLRDLTPTLQRDTLFNFAEACNLDPTIDSKHQFNAKETISHYLLETLNAMMKDAVLKTEAYATHLKVLGLDPDDPDVKRKVYALDHGGTLESLMMAKPLTLTERSGLECAQGYVRGLMNSKLSRVRDIFRAMDDDGSGSVTEEEFHYGLRKIGIQGVSMKDVKLLFKAIDTDKGGTVSYQELRDGLRDRSGSGGSGLRYEGFQCACQMLGLFPLLCPSDGSEEEVMEEKDDEEKIEVDIETIKPNCLKLFHHVSVREKETSRIRIVDYKTMVKAVAHLRLMKYKTKRTDANNRSLAKYKYMDQTSPSSKKATQQPKPPPRPPPRLNNVGKNMLRNSMYIHEQEEVNGGIISKQQASHLVGDWVSGGSRKEKKKREKKKNKKTKAEIQLEKQNEQLKKERDEKFLNLVSMFPQRIQEQLIDMASAFPHEIKSICEKDWIALLTMTGKQQNRVLERMYNRLCDPKNLSASELAKLKADQEKRRMEGRHRGCKSCKAKIKHAVGEDMYLGSIEEALLKEQEPVDPYPVPDWLSGDAGKYTFDDWTVESLLDTQNTNVTNTKNAKLGDMEWGPSDGSSSSKGGRSQTARVRFKPTNTGRNNAANHRRTATAPLLRSGQRSSSPRQRSPGVLMSAPKPIDVGVPVYFKQETAKKINFIGRYGNSKAQNSQLELVKNVYNDVASDPHNNEYKKSLAKGKGTYDRFILPRTDLGNKLARLGAYRNVPMELTYNGRV